MKFSMAVPFLLMASGTLMADTISTLNLVPGSPAAPGGAFTWSMTITNNTGFDLSPTNVDSDFPTNDGIGLAGATSLVALDFDSIDTAYPNGIPNGTTSSSFPLQYFVDPGATPGARVGDPSGPCCRITLSFDLLQQVSPGDLEPVGSGTLVSQFVEVQVQAVAPEPVSSVLLGLSGLGFYCFRRRYGTS